MIGSQRSQGQFAEDGGLISLVEDAGQQVLVDRFGRWVASRKQVPGCQQRPEQRRARRSYGRRFFKLPSPRRQPFFSDPLDGTAANLGIAVREESGQGRSSAQLSAVSQGEKRGPGGVVDQGIRPRPAVARRYPSDPKQIPRH